MKDVWRMRYRENVLPEASVKVLTGLNANLDLYYYVEDLDIGTGGIDPELMEEVKNRGDLEKVLGYCLENGVNEEVEKGFDPALGEERERRLGGQGGIFANFLSGIGAGTVFYTPMLSEQLAELLDSGIEVPVLDDGLVLKRPLDAVNTDQTKENLILEFDGYRTGRLILSDELKGFGPYFRQGLEEKLGVLGEEVDRAVFSGFHDAEGNFEAKIDKAEVQMSKLDVPKHLEYANMPGEKAEKILDGLLKEFDSIGLDEQEALEVADHLGGDTGEELSLGEAYQLGKELIERKGISRCHIHTYRYHAVIVEEDYKASSKKIRRSMLFGENCALSLADQGRLPERGDLEEFNLQDKHIHRLDELEDFSHHLSTDDFTESGIAEIEGYRVVAIPTLVHEDPERVTGMGDIISCGTFAAESG